MNAFTVVVAAVGIAVLGVSALLTVVRLARGPSTLDRVVAADVLVAVVIAALGLEAVVNRHATTLPVILVLSLVGFAGSLSVARFVADRDRAHRWDPAGRPKPRWEPVDPGASDREPGAEQHSDAGRER